MELKQPLGITLAPDLEGNVSPEISVILLYILLYSLLICSISARFQPVSYQILVTAFSECMMHCSYLFEPQLSTTEIPGLHIITFELAFTAPNFILKWVPACQKCYPEQASFLRSNFLYEMNTITSDTHLIENLVWCSFVRFMSQKFTRDLMQT